MKYNIYLLNSEFVKLDDVKIQLIDPEYKPLKNRWATAQFNYQFFLKKNEAKAPGWVGHFNKFVELPIKDMMSSSLSVVILIEKLFKDESRVFAITFGGGWHTIKDEMKEMGFGLRIVLNILVRSGIKGGQARKLAGDTKLKNISLGNPSRFYDLEFNDEIELVRSLHGRSQDLDFATNVKGADSLTLSTKIEFSELEKVLDKAYSYFNSTEYREDFGFIDKFRPIGKGRKLLTENLNQQVVKLITEQDETRVSMIAPQSLMDKGIENWSLRYMAAKQEVVEVLNLFDILDRLKKIEPGFQLDYNSLTNSKVIGISPILEDRVATEQVRCLLEILSAEVHWEGDSYILLDGKWYYVDYDYLEDLHQTLKQVEIVTKTKGHRFPTWAKAGEFYLREDDYNEQVVKARRHNLILLDKKLFRIPEENQNSKIEICDIMSDDLELIHVKKCFASQQYAYLFDQGLVSMETLFQYYKTETLAFINEQISRTPHTYIKFEKLKKGLRDIQLVFAIATKKKAENFTEKLPFFSKIILFRTIKRVRVLVDKPVKIIVIPFEK